MIEFKKTKSKFHSEYRITQDGHFVGYAYRGIRSSCYRVVLYDGSHKTEFKNIQPVKRFVKGLM